MVRGVVRRGLKPMLNKTSISLRVDQDVLEWFKAQWAWDTSVADIAKTKSRGRK